MEEYLENSCRGRGKWKKWDAGSVDGGPGNERKEIQT